MGVNAREGDDPTMINAPDPWTHKSGYRLGADGQGIKYEHPNGNVAIIEGAVNEDPDTETDFEYILFLFDSDDTALEHPDVIENKNRAIDRFEELLEEYA